MKAHRHTPGVMNGLEKRYASHLETLRAAGEIKSWRFEAIKFKLADNTFYTPDFWIVMNDDTVEVHETKGFWAEHNRVKTKVAAAMFFELQFRGVTWNKKDGWQYEEFGRKAA